MPAIADVARLAGVSKATASRALSGRGHVAEETRLRVVEAARRIGFVASPAAASLVTGRTKNVGVVIPFVNRWYFGEVLEGIERALLAAGYDLTLYNVGASGPDRDRVFEFFLARKRVDAVVAVGVRLTPAEVEGLELRGKPVVALGVAPAPGSAALPVLAIDDRTAAALATEHLLRLGHRRLAHLAGPGAAHEEGSVQALRLAGFRDAIASEPGASAVVRETEMSLPGGYEAALQLLGHPGERPTGVFCACDEIAFGTIMAAGRLGVAVPAELSVVGLDGHEYAPLFGLTTLEQRPAEQGRLAVERVMALLGEDAGPDGAPDARADDTDVEADVELPIELVVRTSTTAAPAER